MFHNIDDLKKRIKDKKVTGEVVVVISCNKGGISQVKPVRSEKL